MKQKRRALAFLLALLMVVTSISTPSVSVQAEEGNETVTAELEGVYQFGDYPTGAPEEDSEYDEIAHYNDGGVKPVEQYLYEQMLEKATNIDLSSYTVFKTDIGNLFSAVLNDHPDLYYVEKSYGYTESGATVSRFTPHYDTTTFDDAEFQNAVNIALAKVNDEMSDLQKIIVLHDYLAVNCEYDQINYNKNPNTIPNISHSAYGALVEHVAVCDGYALAFKYLVEQAGIEKCYLVNSNAMNHAWNMVKLNGQYYHVDVTWDDPVWDMTGRACHTYMLCSDTDFQTNKKHSGWQVTSGSGVVSVTATDASYDSAFWADVMSSIVVSGGDAYYIANATTKTVDDKLYLDKNPRIVVKRGMDDIAAAEEEIYNIEFWPSGNGNSWLDAYSGFFQVNGRLYFNDPYAIKSIDPTVADAGKDMRVEYAPTPTPTVTAGLIYGCALKGETVYYALHTTPNCDPNDISYMETPIVAPIVLDLNDPSIIPVESVTLSKSAISLEVGGTETLSAAVAPNNATYKTVRWSSDNKAVATVDGTGKVTAVGAGTCTITAAAGSKSKTCTVTVTALVVAVERIKFKDDHTTMEIEVGETPVLTAIVTPDNPTTDTTVVWTSSDEKIAKVEGSTTEGSSITNDIGKITAIAAGNCKITATIDGKSAECEVTVKEKPAAVESVTLDKTTLSLKAGQEGTLKATVKADDAADKTVTWKSDREAVATVDSNGKVTAVAAGECTITATAGDKSATCKVTVTAVVAVESVALNETELSLEVGDTETLKATVTPDNATDKTVTWTSSKTTVATVDSAGKVTAVAAGECTITATACGKTATCTVTVEEEEVIKIIAGKSKTNYLVNEILNVNDIKICDRNGQEIDAEDYTTNADEIDMSVAGTKYLIVTYEGETAVIEITVLAPETYLIRFDGNGADGGKMESQTMRKGSSSPLNGNSFTRKGYTFSGWNTQPDGKGTSYIDQGTVDTLTQNAVATLYAQWKPNQYTIKYSGGDGNPSGSMSDQTLSYNETVVITNSFTLSGYGFIGWKDASGRTYTIGQVVSGLTAEPNGVVTLTAQWEANAYTITYVLGEEGMNSHENKSYYTSAGVTLKDPVRNGYTFKGWYLDSKYKKALANGTITPAGADITVYAKWEPKKVKVNFDINTPAKGGKATGRMKAQTISFGKGTKLSSNTYKVAGYAFVGWNTLAKPTIANPGIAYENKAATDLALIERAAGDEVTLYAQWRPVTYKITYTNAVDGRNGVDNALPTTYDVEENNIRLDLLNGAAYEPTREGYDFKGWFTDKSCKKELPASTIQVSSAKNLTIYAKWTPVKTLVTFDPNLPDDVDKELDPKEQTVTVGKTLKANTFTAKGYRFSGWNTDAGGSGTKYKNGANVTLALIKAMGEEATLYAQWTPIKSEFRYKITYSGAVDGKNGVSNTNPLGHDGDEEITLDEPERDGYTFTGWVYNGKKLGEDATIPAKKSNITVKATWKGFTTTVEYNSNDENGKTKTQKVTYGKTKKLSANAFKRPGYTFAGWSTVANPDDESAIYPNKAKVTLDIVSDDGNERDEDTPLTLYAQWEPVRYKITYANASMKTDVSGSDVPTYYTVENESVASKDSLAANALLLPSPSRAGYTFAGWYTDKKLTKSLSEFKTSTKKAVTFYASWTPNGYTIVYDANGGTGDSFSQSATYDTAVKLQPNRFVNEDKTFIGWSTSPVAGSDDVIYSSMAKVKNLTLGSKVTLYARWK